MITTMGVGVIVIFSFIFLVVQQQFPHEKKTKGTGTLQYSRAGKEAYQLGYDAGEFCLVLDQFCWRNPCGNSGKQAGASAALETDQVPASFGFEVSVPAIRICLEVFGAIFVLILLVNIRKVYKTNPIQLLHAQNTGEKEPKAKWLMAVAGFICLFIGYYIAITTESPLSALALFFVAVVLVMAGTYLLFTAGSIVVLKVLRWNKKFYYKTKNFTAVSGMLYRMKQNAVGLARYLYSEHRRTSDDLFYGVSEFRTG